MQSSTPQSVVMTTARTSKLPTIGGKYFALAVLFVMNTLNYVDRYAFFAVSSPIQRDLHIDDYWFGWLGAAFMIVYTIVAPFTGWLGDRFNRKLLIFGGVGLWSLATVGAALSGDFYHMFFWRALLGIGEASYGVIAPALLGGPLSGQTSGAGRWGSITSPCRSARRSDLSWGGRSPSTWAGGPFSWSSAYRDSWPLWPRWSSATRAAAHRRSREPKSRPPVPA